MAITVDTSARARILEAALESFDATGVSRATLDEVRARAGVSVGALYHHFADKRAIATALYIDLLDGYQREVRGELHSSAGAREGIEGVVRLHLRWCAREQAGARFLFGQRGSVDEAGVELASRGFLQECTRWYRGHAHYGVVRDLPFDLVHALWLGPSQELTRHWLAGGGGRSVPRRAPTELSRAAWLSLKSDKE